MILSTDQIDISVDPVSSDIPATGALTMTTGMNAVMQATRIRMRMIMGEWFLNLDFGVPYYERTGVAASKALLGQKFSADKAIRAFRDALLGNAFMPPVPGIVDVAQLTVSWTGSVRQLSVNWRAKTAFGNTPPDNLVVGV